MPASVDEGSIDLSKEESRLGVCFLSIHASTMSSFFSSPSAVCVPTEDIKYSSNSIYDQRNTQHGPFKALTGFATSLFFGPKGKKRLYFFIFPSLLIESNERLVTSPGFD